MRTWEKTVQLRSGAALVCWGSLLESLTLSFGRGFAAASNAGAVAETSTPRRRERMCEVGEI